MSVALVERPERTLNTNQGKLQGTRTFWVDGDVAFTSETQVLITAAALATALPDLEYPTTRGTPHPESQGLVALEYDVSRHPMTAKVWEIVWTYGPFEDMQVEDDDPEEEGYTAINTDNSSEFIDAWRSDPALPADLLVAPPAKTDAHDIGGTVLDALGEPGSILVHGIDIEITNVKPLPLDLETIERLTGSRNATTFLSIFPPGTVLFLGTNTGRISSTLMRIGYRFRVDSHYFLRQQPSRYTPNEQLAGTIPEGMSVGDIRIGTDADSDPSDFIDKAYPVWWVQPHTRIEDFAQLGLIIE